MINLIGFFTFFRSEKVKGFFKFRCRILYRKDDFDHEAKVKTIEFV